MIPHPEFARLANAMGRCIPLAAPVSATVYRIASTRYANRDDLLTGAGSRIAGGRWNPLGSFATVYGSLDLHTAADEVLAHHRYYGLPEPTAFPKTIVSIVVQLHRVLDLTAGNVRRALRVGESRLRHDDWRAQQDVGNESLTQAVGRSAKEVGLEGLLVPSAARRRGVNLVFFPENLGPHHRIDPVNKDELPPPFPAGLSPGTGLR